MGNVFLLVLYLTANGAVYGKATVGPLSAESCSTLAIEMTRVAVIDEAGRAQAFTCISKDISK